MNTKLEGVEAGLNTTYKALRETEDGEQESQSNKGEI